MRLIDAEMCERGLRSNITECVITGKFAEADKWQGILEYIQSIPAFSDKKAESQNDDFGIKDQEQLENIIEEINNIDNGASEETFLREVDDKVPKIDWDSIDTVWNCMVDDHRKETKNKCNEDLEEESN